MPRRVTDQPAVVSALSRVGSGTEAQPLRAPGEALLPADAPSAHHARPHPAQLGPEARAQHVLQALTQYNAGVIKANPEGARAKFEKLTTSPFVFFRGTADLFYRDLQGTDAHLPRVLCNGDVHPENFGVMESPDGELIFGLNDFDEAYHAPFSWDLKRGCVGLDLAASEHGLKEQDRQRITESFVQGYLHSLEGFAGNPGENRHRFTEDNSPKVVRSLLKESADIKRKGFLKKRVDLDRSRFLKTDELHPLPARVADFQAALDTYKASLGPDAPNKKKFFKVKDVAAKTGSGTGSIGLWRYYVLVEGKSKKSKDDIILELKHERPSALQEHAGESPLSFRWHAARVANAHRVQVPAGDRLYGHTVLDGASYLVRERSPHKGRLNLATLSPKEFRQYAEVCGAALGQAHARSDKSGAKDKRSSEKKILKSVNPDKLLEQMQSFTQAMSQQMTEDHARFAEAFADGAIKIPRRPAPR